MAEQTTKIKNLRELVAAQHELAYAGAVDTIDACTACLDRNVYDVSNCSSGSAEKVARAVGYLETFGLIERDRVGPSIITIREFRELAANGSVTGFIDRADKVCVDLLANGDEVLIVDGVRISLELLPDLVNPDPRKLYRFERKGDELIVTEMFDAELMAGGPNAKG